jgi:hypothetical protein
MTSLVNSVCTLGASDWDSELGVRWRPIDRVASVNAVDQSM